MTRDTAARCAKFGTTIVQITPIHFSEKVPEVQFCEMSKIEIDNFFSVQNLCFYLLFDKVIK